MNVTQPTEQIDVSKQIQIKQIKNLYVIAIGHWDMCKYQNPCKVLFGRVRELKKK